MWSKTPLYIAESFQVAAFLNFGINDRDGGDGIGFVIQNQGAKIVGNRGGGIGFSHLAPSLGVEFDTFQNKNEPPGDHIAIVRDGELELDILAGPLSFPGNQQIEDGFLP